MKARLGRIVSVLLGLAAATAAAGDELRVAGGGAVKEAVAPLIEDFARESGHFVKTEFAPMGTLTRRLAAGEVFDVLIMTPEALAPLERAGKIAPGTAVPLGKVGIGVAVNERAPVPDISSVDLLRQMVGFFWRVLDVFPRLLRYAF